MNVYDKELFIPAGGRETPLLRHLTEAVQASMGAGEIPIRFVVTKSEPLGFRCELGTLRAEGGEPHGEGAGIFGFRRRSHESLTPFGVAMIIPTGVDCAVGGHSGDAGPVARLLGACCDHLVLHPNVVNASDINELPDNALYVEGSVLSRLLMGTVGLVPVRANRVLLAIDLPEERAVAEGYINTYSAARAALGLCGAGVQCLGNSFRARTVFSASGRASGLIEHLERLFEALKPHEGMYDVLALATILEMDEEVEAIRKYFTRECVNPWGGVEAMLTHTVSHVLNLPSAHAPLIQHQAVREVAVGIVDPRKAAEAVSATDLYCILKGLHRSPRIITDPEARRQRGVINAEDIACLVQPAGCLGLPTLAALEQGMTVIAVRGNHNLMRNDLETLAFRRDRLFLVDNYLEAAGLVCALRAGVDPTAVRRPLAATRIWGFST